VTTTYGEVLLLNNGFGGLRAPLGIHTGMGTQSVVAADFNADAKPDFAVLRQGRISAVAVFLNLSRQTLWTLVCA
jgi:hypothetical protein